jgi:predicted ATPase
MIINEPETSLHPDLLPPLGRLIAAASVRSQLIVGTRAVASVSALHDFGARQIILQKDLGETTVLHDDQSSWIWPSRLEGAAPRSRLSQLWNF